MGDVYKLAIERARKLRAELERLDAFITTYEELASASQPPSEAKITAPLEIPSARPPNEDAPPLKGAPQEELERIALRILLEHGAPLQRQALFDRVKATGITIGGRDERANFGTKISRSDKFVNLAKLGFWPADKPCDVGGYQPGAK